MARAAQKEFIEINTSEAAKTALRSRSSHATRHLADRGRSSRSTTSTRVPAANANANLDGVWHPGKRTSSAFGPQRPRVEDNSVNPYHRAPLEDNGVNQYLTEYELFVGEQEERCVPRNYGIARPRDIVIIGRSSAAREFFDGVMSSGDPESLAVSQETFLGKKLGSDEVDLS